MTLTLTNTVRNAKIAATTALMNGGRIRFLDGSSNTVAITPLATPAFLAPSGGQAFLFGAAVDPFTGSGTISSFRIENAAGATLVSGTVTAVGGGGDIELSDLVYSTGDRLEISNLVYTQPAS